MKTMKKMYGRFPDGSTPDYGRIFQAIDEALGKGKSEYPEVEQILHRYRDARRNYVKARERYEELKQPVDCEEQPYLANAERAVLAEEAKAEELPVVEQILVTARTECKQARKETEQLIGMLQNEQQRLVMTAHYLNLDDWKDISAAYGHQARWAKDIHQKAIKKIDRILRDEDGRERNTACI